MAIATRERARSIVRRGSACLWVIHIERLATIIATGSSLHALDPFCIRYCNLREPPSGILPRDLAREPITHDTHANTLSRPRRDLFRAKFDATDREDSGDSLFPTLSLFFSPEPFDTRIPGVATNLDRLELRVEF